MKNCLLISLLRDVTLVKRLSLKEWDLLIRQARSTGLTARLYYFIKKNELVDFIPAIVLKHFISEWMYFTKLYQSVGWELSELKIALDKKNLPVQLMKGTAYVALDLEVSKGRIFSDIDLLFSHDSIDLAESALMNAGWMGTHHNEYDRNYYRQWMHEIPPLRHVKRQSVLDVHHNILPPTAKIKVNAEKILANIIKVDGENIFCLSPEDLVLHSATHLFHEGDFVHGLRDISDLDLLLKEFSEENVFWVKLIERAVELNLGRPLYYGLRYTSFFLKTSIPDSVICSVNRFAPNGLMLRVMDFVFFRALMPDHPSCDVRWTSLARWLLYIRSHWLRMPMYLLVPHLLRKSWMGLVGGTTH